jgi:hypothetical protein
MVQHPIRGAEIRRTLLKAGFGQFTLFRDTPNSQDSVACYMEVLHVLFNQCTLV